MATPEYHDFNVQLKWDGSKGVVIFEYARNKAITHCVSDDKESIRGLVKQSDLPYQTEQWQQDVGEKLFNAFFPAGSGLGKSFKRTLTRYERVRLRLWYPQDDGQTQELLKIPWEYLFIAPADAPGLKLSGFLCRQPHFSLAHCLQEPATGSGANQLPIRVAFIRDPGVKVEDFQDVQEETTLKRKRRRIIQMESQDKLEKNDFMSAIRTYEIVQFLTHGDPEAFCVKEGTVNAQEVKGSLENIRDRRIRAIVLCACESASHPFSPAEAFHKAGIPVVIGMTHMMNKDQAKNFMEDFYTQLAETACSLEEALAYARVGMLHDDPQNMGNERRISLDWGVPRLFLAAGSSSIIPEELLYKPKYGLIGQFVGVIERRLQDAKENAGNTGGFKFQQGKSPQDWIAGQQRILYLHGPSGSGKSTEIANLFRSPPTEGAQPASASDSSTKKAAQFLQSWKQSHLILHICAEPGSRDEDDNTNHPLVFVRDSLYPQLENLYGKAKFRSWIRTGVYPIMIDDPQDALDWLVVEPLRQARGHGQWERPILVVDGLNHACAFQQTDSILDLLINNKDPLTEVLRLIVAADSDDREVDERIRAHLRGGSLLEGENDISMEMPIDIPKQLEHFKQRLETQLGTGSTDEQRGDSIYPQAQKFQRRLNVNLIGRAMSSDQLIKQIDQAMPSKDDKSASGNILDSYYRLALNSIRASAGQDDQITTDKILKALAVAYAPLPHEMLASLLGLQGVDDVGTVLDRISCFIADIPEKGVICEHPSIKRFLSDDPFFPLDEAHGLFVEMYRPKGESKAWRDIKDWSEFDDSSYVGRYLAEHAYQRYRHSKQEEMQCRARDFLGLMAAPGFRAFRLECAGREAALQDVRRALQVCLADTLSKDAPGATLSAIEHMLAAYSENSNPAILALERRLRCGDGGVNSLKDFLDPQSQGGGRPTTGSGETAALPGGS